jgi:alcohol dehydrogenase class IV
MNFTFATANRIIFGNGTLSQAPDIIKSYGERVLLVVGTSAKRAEPLLNQLTDAEVVLFSVATEPTIPLIEDGVRVAKGMDAQVVIGFGGGSVIDAAKAIAALATNTGQPLDYLEVIGKGQKLTHAPLPFIAIPTTAGTGSEVTKNAVLASPEHRLKVSLRSDAMLADVALVDPELTYSLPASITATTGMDALTQVIEPFVSNLANPLTDGLCREAIGRGGRALRRVHENGQDTEARYDMALVSLLGGLALANAKLGAVHGFAGVIGGMFDAPHGALCATLLPHVMKANMHALQTRQPDSPILPRFDEIGVMLTGNANARAADAVAWVVATGQLLAIPSLSTYGISEADFPAIVEKSRNSSSMKGNPIVLTDDELTAILQDAL